MKNNHEVFRMFTLILQLGITMLTAVFLCLAIGLWIDRTFSTHVTIFFLILGVGGGMKGAYILISNARDHDKEDLP